MTPKRSVRESEKKGHRSVLPRMRDFMGGAKYIGVMLDDVALVASQHVMDPGVLLDVIAGVRDVLGAVICEAGPNVSSLPHMIRLSNIVKSLDKEVRFLVEEDPTLRDTEHDAEKVGKGIGEA